MSSHYGKHLRIQIFGESHGPAIGVVIDGLPAGESINLTAVHAMLERRAPGMSSHVTPRRETDTPEILSGFMNGHTTGAPLTALIRNTDARSKDYEKLSDLPRPSHADYPLGVKYRGFGDLRGGGHFSGRLTAPLVFAGAVALQILERRGITIGAHLVQVGNEHFPSFSPTDVSVADLKECQTAPYSLPLKEDRARLDALLSAVRASGDSIGARIEGCAIGLPAGLGSPLYDGVENMLAHALFGVGGVRGVSFGVGFDAISLLGSAHNDVYIATDDGIRTATNHAGGVLGGMTTGMPLLVNVAMKPTPSIAKAQETARLSTGTTEQLTIGGRHDPCIGIRAVPVIEAVMATVLLDLYLEAQL